ncbi:MAG: methionine aminotransferase [Bacteroidota bacterium]
MNSIESKLPHVGTTIFTIMSGLANETGAINLSQGFPSFEVSRELIELYHQAMMNNHNQYAPMPGLLPLREELSKKTEKVHGAYYNPESEITITAGGTQALYTAITAFINKGDEVIIFEPAYDSYKPAIELAGGIVKPYSLTPPDYRINWEEVKQMITSKTKMIMINTPHNPSGTILSAYDLEQLDAITRDTNIIVLSDEVYEHIIFDGEIHQSVARFENLKNRSVIVYSFGKTFHATGWKTGYCLAPEYLMKEFRKVHQFLVFSVNTPLQVALAAYLKNEEHYLNLPSFYQAKRDYFLSLIEGCSFAFTPCKGSYFQLLDYSSFSNEKDTDLAIRLTKEFGIASIPVSVFYSSPVDTKMLRFCFAKDNVTLEKAAEKIHRIK